MENNMDNKSRIGIGTRKASLDKILNIKDLKS